MDDHIEEASSVDLPHEDINKWVLNAPDPPGICGVVMDSVKGTFSSLKNHSYGFEHFVSVLRSMFPILSWARNYKVKMFKNDLMAGLTLASLCIPQSIGYATLANLEPQYGMYTSVIPPLIYAVMGTSREMAIGPVAVVSLLLSSMLQKLQDPTVNPDGFRNLVFTATLFAGVFQAAFGLFRLGFLVDFLSHAAIVGFMAGAAIVIGLQQLKGLLGISHFTNKTDVVSVGEAVWRSVHHSWNPYNFVLGFSFLCFIMVSRIVGRRYKKLFWLGPVAPLISVALSTLIVYLTKADEHGEAVAVGRSFSTMKGYSINGNKEMVAIGFMNIVGSCTSCYVATGESQTEIIDVFTYE
ncbi:Sulfate transporter 2.1 [Linum perenne]